jgi:hypothetical protein
MSIDYANVIAADQRVSDAHWDWHTGNDNTKGTAEAVLAVEVTDLPHAPTIAKLLAIGEAAWTAGVVTVDGVAGFAVFVAASWGEP